MKPIRYIITLLLIFISYTTISAEKRFFQIDVKQEINSTTWIYVKNGLAQAREYGADAVILSMNTYGGMVVYADSIRTAIINSEIPVYAYINNNAASAGALIAIACDSIYMSKGANIGAATVVDQTGEKMPDKYQSYMRATIRSTAESHGADTLHINGGDSLVWHRNPLIAEAMVDERVVVPGIVNNQQILTFTTTEALRHGYCEGEAESLEQVITKYLKESDYQLRRYEPTLLEEAKGWLTSPALQSILIMIIILGIYYELQTPGLGFPSIAALTAAALYFAPLYIEGVAANWEIIVFVIGFLLVMAEIFIIPGFGIAGILGTLFMVSTLILALIANDAFDFEGIEVGDSSRAVLTVVCGLTLGFTAMLVMIHFMGSKGFMHNVAMNREMPSEEGWIAVSTRQKEMVGATGCAHTFMRPAGKVEIQGEIYDAIALYGIIEKGESVKVVKYENAQLYVVRIND